MAAFPTSLDTLTNPSGSDYTDNPSLSSQLSTLNDIAELIEAKVGIDSSAVTTSFDYKLSGVTGSDKAASVAGTETLTNKTLNSPTLDIPTITNQINLGISIPIVFDDDSDTYIMASLDDTLDIVIANATDFKFTANTFAALSGSKFTTNTIDETTSGSGVIIDGLVIKDATDAGFLKTVNTYTSDATWTKPSGLKFVIVIARGGGGGGGGCGTANGTASSGGGGQGEYSIRKIAVGSLGATENVTIGIGGSGGAATGTNGSVGETTSLGSLITAIGGSGGVASNGTTKMKLGGVGGTGGTADLAIAGMAGGNATDNTAEFLSGQGGGEGGGIAVNVIGTGTAGVKGGGGSGSVCTGTTGQIGGAGGAGWVIVYDYY